MITPSEPRSLLLLPAPDTRARLRIWGGFGVLVLGFGLSVPAAIAAEWQKVLAYLVITAAGLCLIFTGSVRRAVLSGQTNHLEQMSATTTLIEKISDLHRGLRLMQQRQDEMEHRQEVIGERQDRAEQRQASTEETMKKLAHKIETLAGQIPPPPPQQNRRRGPGRSKSSDRTKQPETVNGAKAVEHDEQYLADMAEAIKVGREIERRQAPPDPAV